MIITNTIINNNIIRIHTDFDLILAIFEFSSKRSDSQLPLFITQLFGILPAIGMILDNRIIFIVMKLEKKICQ